MIRGIVENGIIRPLDPLPHDWSEDHAIVVEDAPPPEADDIDAWYRELQQLGPARFEPGEREHFDALLEEADREAKEYVRKSIGLA